MPLVTALKHQRRNPDRCNVYIDQAFACAIPLLELSSQGLFVGRELSEVEVEQLALAAERGRLFQQAVGYVGLRRRSWREVLDYLQRRGADEVEAANIVERMQQSGLVNDLEFGRAWVADRRLLRPRSRRQLEQELQRKGLSRDTIEQVLGEVSGDDQDEALRQVIAKRRRVGRSDPQALMQYLLRQGFGCDQIKRLLKEEDESGM